MSAYKKFSEVVLHDKPARALALLRENQTWYASLLAKRVDCTYPHMIKILREFQEAGLVSEEKKGRTKILRLTDNGNEVAKAMDKLIKQLDKL